MTGIGRERIDLNGTGLEQTPLNRLDRIKLDWSTRRRSGLDWTEPESISED